MTRLGDRAAERAATRAHAQLAEDIERLRLDAGISIRDLAAAAGVDSGFVARIVHGQVRASLGTYARLAVPLGADLATRLYPNTGPLIRDRHQAAMLEALLGVLHPRWHAFTEVAVRRPSRGWIDALLHEPRERLALAAELQSELRRLEQLIRWSGEKAASVPSWDGWDSLGDEPRIDRLLIVRRTRVSREVAAAHDRQLRVAFPAHPDDAAAALTGTAPWPGPALVWSVVDGRGARLVSGR